MVRGAPNARIAGPAYDGLWLEAGYTEAEGAPRWGLVLNRRALRVLVPRVMAWVQGHGP